MNWRVWCFISLLFVISASAQGSLGGSQASCGSDNAFEHLGCYADSDNGPHAGFTFLLSSDPNSVNYYPFYNGSLTPQVCQDGCRSHGFKFAGLYNGINCYCSTLLPNPSAKASTIQGIGSPGGSKPGTSTSSSTCEPPGKYCSGDSNQFCGSSNAIDVYSDPSIDFTADEEQALHYTYLGCFRSVSPGPFFAVLETTSTADCASYCGLLGYTYMGRNGIDYDPSRGTSSDSVEKTCGCGSEVRTGIQVDESYCNFYCNGSIHASYVFRALPS
jgi:hypothetical protein